MKTSITIGTIRYIADTAAISCLRYRSMYGESAMVGLQSGSDPVQLKASLTKLVWIMINDPTLSLKEFAEQCKNDPSFTEKALLLRGELFRVDGRYQPKSNSTELISPEEYDEFDLIARMGVMNISSQLLYELTMSEISSIMGRAAELRTASRRSNYKRALFHEATEFFMGGMGHGHI